MPELPEVQTTVDGLNRTVAGLRIISLSNSYRSAYYQGKDEIKNPEFFKKFKKRIVGHKILKAERRAKNILIHLSSQETILVHMKMTGYFFYNPPKVAPFVRLSFALDNGRILAFSDMRKFAKVTLLDTKTIQESIHLKDLGPEPLEKNFQFPIFKFQLMKRPKGKIKQALMDPSIIAGIGNIYSDEILWRAGVHPLSIVRKIPEKNLKLAFRAMKEVLKKGIHFGGDSMSDYRNIAGEKGRFQEHHRAYMLHGTKCLKKGRSAPKASGLRSCSGKLEKIRVGGRSAHFCSKHQKLYV